MKKQRILVLVLALPLLATVGPAHSTTWPDSTTSRVGNVVYAASCEEADVQAAVDAAVDGDTVIIPPGTCTWTSPTNTPAVLIHQKAITLQGSGPEATIINDSTGTSWGDYALQVNGIAGKPFRITGIYLINAGGGGISITGTAMDWRVDHCGFSSPSFWTAIFVNGYSYGVVHDCSFLNSRVLPIDGDGHAAWKRPLNLGGSAAVFVESCQFEWNSLGNSIDSNHGGRYVFRFNRVMNNYLEAHSLQNNIADAPYGFARATRSYEIYHNEFEAVDNNPAHTNWVAVFLRGGTGVVFNNSVENRGGPPYSLFGVVDNVRSFRTLGAPLLSCDGTNPLDGNEEANGYPCLDQIGRSTDHGPDNQFHPQDLEPLYSWNNTLNGLPSGLSVHNNTGHHIQEGRDFYNHTPRPQYIPYPYPHPLTLADYPGEQRALELRGWASPDQAHLSWQAVTGTVAYRVVRNWDWTTTVTTTNTSFQETWGGPEHIYMVYALDGANKILAAEGVLLAGPELTLHGRPGNRTIYLDWEVNTSPPPTSTWTIAYDGPTGDQPSPITGILSPTRAYTLTGLTNYTWYTVTLNAMVGSTPFLTDTVRVMPTDIFVYLPLVRRGD